MVIYRRTVKRIVDGDTLELRRSVNGSRFVRLADVDAPEMGSYAGQRAQNVLKGLISGSTIGVKPVARDVYGRIVAEVTANRININRRMQRKGY